MEAIEMRMVPEQWLTLKEIQAMEQEAREYTDHLEPVGEYGLQSFRDFYEKIQQELLLGNHDTPATFTVIGPSGAGKSTAASNLFLLSSQDVELLGWENKHQPIARRFLRWGRMIDAYGQIMQPDEEIVKGALSPQMHDKVARFALEKVQTVTNTLQGIPSILGVELVGFPGLPMDVANVSGDLPMQNKNRGLQALSYIAQSNGYAMVLLPDEGQILQAVQIRDQVKTDDTSDIVRERNISVYGTVSDVDHEWGALSAPAETILRMQDELVHDMYNWHTLGVVDLANEDIDEEKILSALRNNVAYRIQMLSERVVPTLMQLLGFEQDHVFIAKNKVAEHTPFFLHMLREFEIE